MIVSGRTTSIGLLPEVPERRETNTASGATVTFSSGTPGMYIAPLTALIDSNGEARWTGYLHSSGQVQILASVAGQPTAVFTVNVTPAGHPGDGEYVLTHSLTRTTGAKPTPTITLHVDDAAVLEAERVLSGQLVQKGTIDWTTGAFTISRKPCGNVCSGDL